MSKKTKRKRQNKSFPWAFVAVGVVLLTAAIFLFSNTGSADSSGTPIIAVEESNIDLGYIKMGEYRSLNIKVTNTGTGTLRFKEQPYIEVLEGCCPPQLSVGTMASNPVKALILRLQIS